MIAIYINDTSIHGQFAKTTFPLAFNVFLDLLAALLKIQVQKQFFLCKSFYYKHAIANEVLISSIKSNRDLNLRFTSLFQTVSFKYWNDAPEQDFSVKYVFKNTDYVTTIIAEAAEARHKMLHADDLLVNVSDSIFSSHVPTIISRQRNGDQLQINLDSHDAKESLITWISTHGIAYPKSRAFEHNLKHHFNVSEQGDIAKLECSYEEAQLMLTNAISEDGVATKKLYNFDVRANKFVVFRKHQTDTYHGYHEKNSQKIPFKVRQHYNQP